jgi:hypothetical protein
MGRIGTYEQRQSEMKTSPVCVKRDRVGIIVQLGAHNESVMEQIQLTMSTCRVSSAIYPPEFRQASTKRGSARPDGFYLGKWEGQDVAIWLLRSCITGEDLRDKLGLLFAFMGDEQRLIMMSSAASVHGDVHPGEVRLINKMKGDGVGWKHLRHDDPDVFLDSVLPCNWPANDYDKPRQLVMARNRVVGRICLNLVCFRGPLWPPEMLWRQHTMRTAMTDPAQIISLGDLARVADLIAIENHDRKTSKRLAFAPCGYVDRSMFRCDRSGGFSDRVPPVGNGLKKVVGAIRRLARNDWVPSHLV